MKIAVSIPDPLFEAAENLARRRKLSRSQVYARALELLLTREDDSDITARLDAVYASQASDIDRGLAAAQSAALHEEW